MIVGVVGDVAEGLVVQKPRPALYFPLRAADYAQPGLTGITLILRAVPGVDALSQVRREIAGLDPNVTIFNARSMRDHVEEFMTMLRVASWTYGFIGIFGYVLSAVGLAGVTAYAVQQRRRELGIRMALGATAGQVVRLVMVDGALLVAAGTAAGFAGAFASSRGLAALNNSAGKLTSVSPDDPFVILGLHGAAGRFRANRLLPSSAKIRPYRSGRHTAPGVESALVALAIRSVTASERAPRYHRRSAL